MPIEMLLEKAAVYGPMGVMLLVVTYGYYLKDKELQAEKKERITDAKDFTKTAMDLQSKVIDATNKLADILEQVQRSNAPGRGR